MKLTHLASVGFTEILPYASAVGEDDVSVGIQFVRELAPASILVDNGLDSLQRLGVRGHTRDWYPAPPAGDGEYFGTLLQETPDCFDLEDSILGFVFFRSKIIILSIRSSRQICTDFRLGELVSQRNIVRRTNNNTSNKPRCSIERNSLDGRRTRYDPPEVLSVRFHDPPETLTQRGRLLRAVHRSDELARVAERVVLGVDDHLAYDRRRRQAGRGQGLGRWWARILWTV